MKITIDPDLPELSEDERAELKESAVAVESDPAGFKRAMLTCKEAHFSPQVVEKLAEHGLTPDDVIAAMLKEAGASQ